MWTYFSGTIIKMKKLLLLVGFFLYIHDDPYN